MQHHRRRCRRRCCCRLWRRRRCRQGVDPSWACRRQACRHTTCADSCMRGRARARIEAGNQAEPQAGQAGCACMCTHQRKHAHTCAVRTRSCTMHAHAPGHALTGRPPLHSIARSPLHSPPTARHRPRPCAARHRCCRARQSACLAAPATGTAKWARPQARRRRRSVSDSLQCQRATVTAGSYQQGQRQLAQPFSCCCNNATSMTPSLQRCC